MSLHGKNLVAGELSAEGESTFQAIEAASGIQVCPVTAREFPKAALHFPIVFTPTDNFFPVVILSLSKGKNPFVVRIRLKRLAQLQRRLDRRAVLAFGAASRQTNSKLCL